MDTSSELPVHGPLLVCAFARSLHAPGPGRLQVPAAFVEVQPRAASRSISFVWARLRRMFGKTWYVPVVAWAALAAATPGFAIAGDTTPPPRPAAPAAPAAPTAPVDPLAARYPEAHSTTRRCAIG